MKDKDPWRPKPYSPEIKGDLKEYLIKCEQTCTSNLFLGSEYYFVMKDRALIIPKFTFIRLGNSPAPDIGYFIDENYSLSSPGPSDYNMSLVLAEKGTYDPKETLENKLWTIFNLKIWE